MGGLGLCVGLLRGSAVELGRRPPHGPAPLEALVGAILFRVLPPPAPGGIRCPHARPEPRLGGLPPGPLPEGGGDGRGLPHPLRQREGDPPSRGSKHGKPGGDLHPGRRQGLRPVRPGGHLLAKGVPGHRATLNDATQPMLARGRALATDFSGTFSNRCVHFPEFLGEVNRQLTAFLRRRQALRRTFETCPPCAASMPGWTSSCAPPRRSWPQASPLTCPGRRSWRASCGA